MKRASFALAVLVGLGIPAVAGAGPSASPAFVTRGNAICRSYDRKLSRMPVVTTPESAWLSYVSKVVALTAAEQARFKAISPPAAYRLSYAAWLAVSAKGIANMRRVIAAGEQSDLPTVKRLLAQEATIATSYDTLANTMGLKVCGRSSTQP